MISGINQKLVGVRQINFDQYPATPPFDPDKKYAEYDFEILSTTNNVYDSVRSVFLDLQLDWKNRDTKNWNPFKEIISPGDKVVIKPNLVLDAADQDAITTHASVIRPIVDYSWKALQGRGVIVICDAPLVEADFDKIVLKNGLKQMVKIMNERGCKIILADIRTRKTRKINDVVVAEKIDPEKDQDAVVIDLKEMSFLDEDVVKQNRLSYGAYRRDMMKGFHRKGKHLYKVSRMVLSADVVISIPKLKTHKKAGITCCLKNLVGINVDKNYLPHFTSGPANLGGDEFPPIAFWRFPALFIFKTARLLLLGHWRRYMARLISSCAGLLNRFKFMIDEESPSGKAETAQRVYQLVTGTDYGGSWSGNETIWRMILDLNRIFLFADSKGNILSKQQRKAFYVVDGFISGVKNGPLTPHVIRPGIVAAGFNAAVVDRAMLELVGIDANKIPLYREAFTMKNDWLHGNSALQIKLNGRSVDPSHTEPLALLLEPKYWHFARDGIQS
ncbi:MAG: DUF362 domain-containing protein [Candidatus Aminicenantes bacterium]|nr:DUF362 domain-containing protein [Candidatus Aminicenantes bacterium]